MHHLQSNPGPRQARHGCLFWQIVSFLGGWGGGEGGFWRKSLNFSQKKEWLLVRKYSHGATSGQRKLSLLQLWLGSCYTFSRPPSEPRWQGASPPASWVRSSLCWPAWSRWSLSCRAPSLPPCITPLSSSATQDRAASTLLQQDLHFWVRKFESYNIFDKFLLF